MTDPVAPFNFSMVKPVSLFELSVHAKLICVAETAVAANAVGAAGTVGVTVPRGVATELSFVYGELPASLNAVTR